MGNPQLAVVAALKLAVIPAVVMLLLSITMYRVRVRPSRSRQQVTYCLSQWRPYICVRMPLVLYARLFMMASRTHMVCGINMASSACPFNCAKRCP
jgi:hypothetical protein